MKDYYSSFNQPMYFQTYLVTSRLGYISSRIFDGKGGIIFLNGRMQFEFEGDLTAISNTVCNNVDDPLHTHVVKCKMKLCDIHSVMHSKQLKAMNLPCEKL